MTTMQRFRVRTAAQTFQAKGPDLLRTKASARGTLRALMSRPAPSGWYVRKQKEGSRSDWAGPMSKPDVLATFDAWRYQLPELVVGRMKDKKVTPLYLVRSEPVPFLDLANCSKATSELHSLIHYAWPKVVHSGDYLFRQVAGSDWWSDHAWGTALDESPRGGMTNDQLFDWAVRMFATRNAVADYILGSLKGRVMEASEPDWSISPSDAAASHTWHNHISVVDHDGNKPPKPGGVP